MLSEVLILEYRYVLTYESWLFVFGHMNGDYSKSNHDGTEVRVRDERIALSNLLYRAQSFELRQSKDSRTLI